MSIILTKVIPNDVTHSFFFSLFLSQLTILGVSR